LLADFSTFWTTQ